MAADRRSLNRFRFYIDGQAIDDGFTSYNNLNLSITVSAPDSGTHTLQITKVNEAQQGEAVLQGLTLDQGGTWVPSLTWLAPLDSVADVGQVQQLTALLSHADSFLLRLHPASHPDAESWCLATAIRLDLGWEVSL